MEQFSILGLFCEDIREESGDVITLIGLLPDNLNMEVMDDKGTPAPPTAHNRVLSKICVFVRANFDPDDPVNSIRLSLGLPNDMDIPLGEAQPDILAKSKADAKANGLPLAGIVLRAAMNGFILPKPGIVRLKASIDGKEKILAMLRFQIIQRQISNDS